MEKFLLGLFAGIAGIAIWLVFSFLSAWFVLMLWNWIMPLLFGLPVITYWVAWGVSVLSGLLFGGGFKFNTNSSK